MCGGGSSCIAMSLPVFVRTATRRNALPELRRFLSDRFPSRYLVFNLCGDAHYSDEAFAGRVERLPVETNNPPRLRQMAALLQRAARFLDAGPGRCIAVHCTTGEGRTGAMVAAWLVYSGFAESAEDAMAWFAVRWTGRRSAVARQGVPMPSQRRYVKYVQVRRRRRRAAAGGWGV